MIFAVFCGSIVVLLEVHENVRNWRASSGFQFMVFIVRVMVVLSSFLM